MVTVWVAVRKMGYHVMKRWEPECGVGWPEEVSVSAVCEWARPESECCPAVCGRGTVYAPNSIPVLGTEPRAAGMPGKQAVALSPSPS